MAEDPYSGARDEARKSLERMQNFDVDTLPRDDELGQKFTFREAVEPATRLIDLYKRLSLSVLDDLPPNALTTLQDRANVDHQRFTQILEFDPMQDNAKQAHQKIIKNLQNHYQDTFNFLHPLISYSLYKTADFKRLEGEARAAVQSIRDQV